MEEAPIQNQQALRQEHAKRAMSWLQYSLTRQKDPKV